MMKDDTLVGEHLKSPKHAETCEGPPSAASSDFEVFLARLHQWQHGPRQDRSTLTELFKREVLEHQLGVSVNLILLACMSYMLFPELRHTLGAFISLSYGEEGQYGLGRRDLLLVLGFIVIFTAIRGAGLDFLFKPLARTLGIRKNRTRLRFSEQSYMIVYYTIYWSWGLVLFIRETPDKTEDTRSLLLSVWTSFPKLRLGAGMKLYYLSQLAFWLQQLAVLHLEDKRKDHIQMLLHHIITIGLLAASYPYRQWRAGNAILVCMDLVDVVLPLAKVLRYLSCQQACNAVFAVFVVLWFVMRHVLYLAICWSIYTHVSSQTMLYGTYSITTGVLIDSSGGKSVFSNIFQPFIDESAETVAFNSRIHWLFLGLLMGLQGLMIAWFLMILKIVKKVVRGEGADDTRSDSEEDSAEAR